MPCVWPMIPITVNFFVKQGQADKSKGKTTSLAIAYCLAIIGIFTGTIYAMMALGIVASFRINRVVNLGIPGIAVFGATIYFQMSNVWGAPVLVSARITQAFAARLDGLGDATRSALVLAAASDSTDPALLERAAGALGADLAALAAAEERGLVALGGGAIAFPHPLARSAVYAAATPEQRRAAHRALADALPDRDAGRVETSASIRYGARLHRDLGMPMSQFSTARLPRTAGSPRRFSTCSARPRIASRSRRRSRSRDAR